MPTHDALEGQHLQLRYMTRFHCIGPACEDHCCYGWRVDIDEETYHKMMVAAQFSAKEIAPKLHAALEVVPGSRRKRTTTRYQIRHDEHDACPLLDAQNLCEVHKHFGHGMLSDVCAIYPRKLKRVGDHLELTATPSCPELSRELLLAPDAVDIVPLDPATLERVRIQGGVDTRDRRPFVRSTLAVRDLIVELLRDEALSLEERHFLMLWFAKRTHDVLQKAPASPDLARVERELQLLRDPRFKAEILKRFATIETPTAVALMVVRSMVRPHRSHHPRKAWNRLTEDLIGSYATLRSILPDTDDEAAHDRAAEDRSERVMMTIGEVWAAYRVRRDRLRARVGDRMDQFLRNYTIHTWIHRLPYESKDVLSYTLRYLALQAVQKFVVYSSPALQALMDAHDARPDLPAEQARAELAAALDRVAVDAFYQLSRHIEHGSLITYLAKMLKAANLFSMAGGVYLLRF